VIVGEVTGVSAVQNMLGKKGEAIYAAVKKSITALSLKLSVRVKESKLSGQSLNVKTGRLRRSINAKVAEDNGQIVGSVGTNVEYARIHELGSTKDQQVRAHMRTIKEAWGKSLAQPIQIQVKAHTRKANTPARPFLKPALDEMEVQIKADIAKAVGDACVSGS